MLLGAPLLRFAICQQFVNGSYPQPLVPEPLPKPAGARSGAVVPKRITRARPPSTAPIHGLPYSSLWIVLKPHDSGALRLRHSRAGSDRRDPRRSQVGAHGANPSRLDFARRRRGMTQTALAEAAGVVVLTIKFYEAGTKSPSAETLAQLATALDFPVAFLTASAAIEMLDLEAISFRS